MGFWRAIERARLREERGAYAILFAILIVVIFMIVALVIDLGQAKATVRDNQSVADFAALAAGPDLEVDPVNPQAACTDAWLYLKANLPNLPAGTTSPCSSFPATCDNLTTPATTYTVNSGRYTIQFRYPVPNGDAMLGATRPGDSPSGTAEPCRRLGVTVRTQLQSLFGGITGSNGLSAPASAVVRGVRVVQHQRIAALLILDPHGCLALTTGGNNTQVWVHNSGPNPGPDTPGLITLDSDATTNNGVNGCSNSSSYSIDTNNNGNTVDKIKAFPAADGTLGEISLFALPKGATLCPAPGAGHACEAVDVSSGRMNPQPDSLSKRATRAPADWAFDCLPSYAGLPAADRFPLTPGSCPNSDPTQPGFVRPFISDLRTAVGRNGNSTPSGFTKWSALPPIAALASNQRCSPPAAVTITRAMATAIYVDCNTLSANNGITFEGQNIVFQGNVSVGSTGFLNVNTNNNNATLSGSCQTDIRNPCDLQSSTNSAFMFLRSGGSLTKGSQASMNLHNVMVYIDNGNIDLGGGGTGTLIWLAPTIEGPWVRHDPTTGAQAGTLALWSEANISHNLNGQAGMNVRGVFFTPGADYFNFHGQGLQTQTSAQFITYRLNIDGNGLLEMTPNPQTALPLITTEYELIR